MIKKLLPYQLKVSINLIRNQIIDLFKRVKYAKKNNIEIDYIGDIEVTQEIKKSKTTNAKIKNINIAIFQIEQILIYPNEVFSFWKIVGEPSKKNGFVESRSIVNGKITPTYGGGLCQLSGLIYFASLYANIEIIERHNHSTDIYTNETRFTPLGSDATVVFGFKDLKIKNNLKAPIRFTFIIKQEKLTIRINSGTILKKVNIKFVQNENNRNEIITYVNEKYKTNSVYKKVYT
jgi:vancomycin resistance protein VanW